MNEDEILAGVDERDSAVELERVIERYNAAWNAHDVDAIVGFHAPGMVFENHTAGERVEGEDVREHIARIFEARPDLTFDGDGCTRAMGSWSASGRRPRPTARDAGSSGRASTSFRSRTA